MSKESGQGNSKLSFAYVDLDGFSEINNKYGHSFGDEVLEEIEKFGNKFVKTGWNFDREYGQGDEFLIEMPGVDKDLAKECMEEFQDDLSELKPNGVQVTASIGIATYPGDGQDKEATIDKADQAMLNAEDWGGDKIVVSGKETPTKEIGVWFEEYMELDEDDLIEVRMWIDKGSKIRAAELYNKTKDLPFSSHIAGSFMTAEKIEKPIEGIVSEIRKISSDETEFSMMVEESRLDELGLK
jgi:diguanylate cyclase (GGDEF)-like protein